MSDANYTELAYVPEVTFGVTPSPATLTALRFTGEAMAHDKATVLSEEIRSDRQRNDLINVGNGASGSISFELNQADWQPFILAALGAAAWTAVNVSAAATAAVATQTLTTTSAGFADVPAGGVLLVSGFATAANNGLKRVLSKSVDGNVLTLAAGSITAGESATIAITGKDARNGTARHSYTIERGILAPDGVRYYQPYSGLRVDELSLAVEAKKVVTGELKFMGVTGATSRTSVNNASGAFASRVLTVGSTDPADGDVIVVGNRTYTLRTALGSGADEILLSGTPATLATRIAAAINGVASSYNVSHRAATAHTQVSATVDDDEVTVTALVMGTAANAYATTTTASTGELDWAGATMTGGTNATAVTEASTAPVLNGTSNVGTIYYGSTVATARFRSLKFAIKANLRPKDAIGVPGPWEIGYGTLDVTGTLEAYFQDNDIYQSLIAHQYTAVSFVLTDALGKSLAVTFPYVAFGAGGPTASGINTDIMINPEFTAIMHPDLLSTVIVNAFD